MLTTENIAQTLQDASATNGWDAVFAMNLKQVNALFFQEFLNVGPTNTRAQTFLRCALMDDSSMLILDAGLGPAELSLQARDTKATVEMELIAGALITLDLDSLTIKGAAWVRPNESRLTGSLELAKVKGEVNQLGKVVMDLGASAYTPTISGVDPKSVLNTKIGEAVQTFFRVNAATYTLGIIGNADVPPSLTPTSFIIRTQQHPGKLDSCVLVLIQTDGQPGTDGPLASYPIPDNCGAALLIAERPLFSALADDLNKSFKPFGTQFSARQASGVWSTVGSGGSIDCGAYGQPFDCNHENEWDRSGKVPWTSDGNGNGSSVQFGLDGFTISGADGRLVATWNNRHAQNVSQLYRNYIGISLCATRTNVSTLQADFKVLGTPAVDPGSSIVSFTFSKPDLSVKPVDYPNWAERLFGATAITGDITSAIEKNLLDTLKSFTVLTINAFRLKCLLFQSADTVELTGAALPKGVYLTGNAAMPITVTPASTMAQPGEKVQFSAAGLPSSNVMWKMKPGGCGSIDPATGLYTAPASLSSAQVIVVTAIDKSNTSSYGSAMLLVYQSPAAQGVAVAPGRSLVTPDNRVKLYASDKRGNPLTVNWTLSPNTGSISPGFEQGEYVYKAPAQLSGVTEVTATAVDVANPALTGTAVIQLAPSTSIAVQPAQNSVKLGAQLALKATVAAGDPQNLRWVVFPSGAGQIKFDLDDPTKATYSAPAKIVNGNQVHVLAYLVDEQTAGSGSALITLTP
jgi:hypothetical protein